VIRSFRQDKPYDRFLQEQLADDEIDANNQEMLVASSFHRLGPLRKSGGNQDTAYNRNEVLMEMTNVIGSALLGVTLVRSLSRPQVRSHPPKRLLPYTGILRLYPAPGYSAFYVRGTGCLEEEDGRHRR
jgi:hypothetical protein